MHYTHHFKRSIDAAVQPIYVLSSCSDKLRLSRSGISEADVANDFALGIPGEAFSFSHCSNKVTVAESSGLTGKISQVEQFIREHVKP